jgi:hypothetical protein
MWDLSRTNSRELFKLLATTGGPVVGRPGLDPGTLGLKEGCIWSAWSGGVGIIRISKKTCSVVSDWSVCSYGFVKSKRRDFRLPHAAFSNGD